MNNLIKIETKENGQRLVSARELHEKLKVQQDFTDWIKKQLESVDAIENADFTRFPFKREGNNATLVEYAITVEIAKEICMVVGVSPRTNEETKALSKKFRRYFIECEKKLNTPVAMTEKDKVLLEMDIVERTSKMLNLNDNSKLLCLHNVLENHNIPTNILPQYTESKGQLLPATELLKRNNVNMSAIKFNKLMLEQGLIAELERPSSKGTKKFKSLVDTCWGENQTCPKNPKETQILYYTDKFGELLHKLNLG